MTLKPVKAKRWVYRLVGLQFCVILLCSAMFMVLMDKHAAWSAGLGGMVCIIPNAYLVRKVFARTGVSGAKMIVRSFYLGECVKFGVTIIWMIVLFKLFNIVALPFFVTYIVTQLCMSLFPLVFPFTESHEVSV